MRILMENYYIENDRNFTKSGLNLIYNISNSYLTII